jgi:hypothetical protein
MLLPDGKNRSSLREICQALYRVRRALQCNRIQQTPANLFFCRPHEHPFTWRIAHTHIGSNSRDRRLIKPDRPSPDCPNPFPRQVSPETIVSYADYEAMAKLDAMLVGAGCPVS